MTANGSLLATASHKGTVIRVWDVSTSQNVYEFRRGVERASITCLAFSWDDQWLSCASDKGTTHIFYCERSGSGSNGHADTDNGGGRMSATSSLLRTGSRLLSFSTSMAGASKKNQQPKSVCQIRGVPHPLSCAFIGDAPNLIAVAGWDADGNGVLLISEFAAHQEARRVAYHVLVKNAMHTQESEEERRRRRARGWRPTMPDTPSSDQYFGNMRISDEDAEALEQQFQTVSNDDDFCEVIVEPRKEPVIEDKTALPGPPPATPEGNDDDGDSLGAVEDDDDDNTNNNNKGTVPRGSDPPRKKTPTKNVRKETIAGVGMVNGNNNDSRDLSSIDQLSEKDSVTNHDSIQTEPLEEEEDDVQHPTSASAETFVQ